MKFRQKITYSMGNFANTVCYQAFSNRVKFFYTSIVGLPTEWVGGIWVLFGIWNAVNDPLMGQWSDRTRSRWGRRIPFILFGSVPLGISFLLLWTPPSGSPFLIACYFTVTVFLFDTVYSLLTMAYNALFPEMVRAPGDRAQLSALREGTALVGLVLALASAPILAERIGYFWMGMVFAVATTLGYQLSVIDCKENPPPADEEQPSMIESGRIALSSRAFRLFLIADLSKEVIWLMVQSMLPFYARHVLHVSNKLVLFGTSLSPGDQEAILLAVPFLFTAPFLALWGIYTPRIGASRSMILTFLLFIPGLLVMFIANDFASGLLSTTLLAPGLAGTMVLPHVLLAEIIDDDAARTGKRREGIFYGITGAAIKLAFSLEGILFGSVLWVVGYEAKGEVQTGAAIWGIRLLIAGAPIAACLVGSTALLRFPLADREEPMGFDKPVSAGGP